MKLTHRYTALLVLFAFTTLIPVSAADTVPFHAAIDTTPVPVQVPGCDPPGCIGLEIGGQGTATHMGRIAVAGPSQVVPTSMSGGLQTGESVLTAANGDTLTIAFDGTFDAPQGPFGPVTFAGAWAVVDGSGRFSGATGGGSYSGSATLAAGLGVLLLDGDIARRGPRR